MRFLPGARFHILTPLYDIGCSLLGLGKGYRKKVLRHLRLGKTVLDAGCGTGSLAIEIAQQHNVRLHAIDADPRMLTIAQKKSVRVNAPITFRQSYLQALPYDKNTFDTIYSSLVFHHIPKEGKQQALHEIHRVLKTGGYFYLIDIGRSRYSLFPWIASLLEQGRENRTGELLAMVQHRFPGSKVITRLRHGIEIIAAVKYSDQNNSRTKLFKSTKRHTQR